MFSIGCFGVGYTCSFVAESMMFKVEGGAVEYRKCRVRYFSDDQVFVVLTWRELHIVDTAEEAFYICGEAHAAYEYLKVTGGIK